MSRGPAQEDTIIRTYIVLFNDTSFNEKTNCNPHAHNYTGTYPTITLLFNVTQLTIYGMWLKVHLHYIIVIDVVALII